MEESYLDKILGSIMGGNDEETENTPIPIRKTDDNEKSHKEESKPEAKKVRDGDVIVIEETADYKVIKKPDEPLPIYHVKLFDTYHKNKSEIEKMVGLFYSKGINEIRTSELSQIKDWIKQSLPEDTRVNESLILAASKWIKYRVDGYGPLQVFIDDDDLEEIMVNGLKVPVFVYHRKFKMCKTNLAFHEEEEVIPIIEKIARETGRHIDAQIPLLDAHLSDGSRVNATIPPISPDGPTLTIRKFKKDPLTIIDLIRFGSINTDAAAFLWLAVDGLGTKPANILVSGGTGSGKTTLLNSLSLFIPPDQRVITIEDTLELQLTVDHWVRLQTRPPNIEGKGEVSMDALLKNTLRMRPDRIVVGEVRGEEAHTLFTAMNTGHDGCMSTIHANDARETITRITTPPMNVPSIMAKTLDFVVVSKRFNLAGKGIVRRVIEIGEVTGMEGDKVTMSYIYKYDASVDTLVETKVASQYLNALSRATGMPLRKLLLDKAERALVLEYLAQKGIRNITEVGKYIKRFYMDRQGLLEKIQAEIESGTLDIKGE